MDEAPDTETTRKGGALFPPTTRTAIRGTVASV